MVSQVELSPRRPRRPKTPKCPKPSVGGVAPRLTLRCRRRVRWWHCQLSRLLYGCVCACTDAAISPPRATCNSRGRTLVMSVFAPTLNKLTPASEPATSLEAGKRWLDGWEGEFSRQFNGGLCGGHQATGSPRDTINASNTLLQSPSCHGLAAFHKVLHSASID